MKDLGKWQIISFISRGLAQVIGIAQGYIFVRVLSKEEYGTLGIALAVGSSLGILQSLGLTSASTREISRTKDHKEIFKIFTTSAAIRLLISVPVAFMIFFGSTYLSVKYANPQLAFPLKLYALVILAQGMQGLFNSMLQGMKRFKFIFIYQVIIALVTASLYIPFVIFYRVNGYFYGMLALNTIASAILLYASFKPLKNFFQLPSKQEFMVLFRELFSISLVLFIVKIIYTNWQNVGPNILGLSVSAATVATFVFAINYSKKLLTISDSVTDVNLTVFSEKYLGAVDDFVRLFKGNFNKIFVVTLAVAFSAAYWSREVIVYGKLSGYLDAPTLILPIIFAYVCYSFIDIFKSSVLVPAKMTRELLISFLAMLTGTVAFFFAARNFIPLLNAMAVAMVFGTSVTLVLTVILCHKKIGAWIFTHEHYILIAQALVISLAGSIDNLAIKTVAFVLFAGLYGWAVLASRLVDLKGRFRVPSVLSSLL